MPAEGGSMALKILWGITGSGDKIEDTVNIMLKLNGEYDIDMRVAMSKNGEKVARMYEVWEPLKNVFEDVLVEKGPNVPFLVGGLQTGKYDLFIVCPATANTTAKIAHGIADSLISNCVSQALKANREVYIYPVDQKPGDITTVLPDGKELILSIREVDLENSERLKRMRGVTVISELDDIEGIIKKHLTKLRAS
jgi:archaeoflavoprotein AfpA